MKQTKLEDFKPFKEVVKIHTLNIQKYHSYVKTLHNTNQKKR